MNRNTFYWISQLGGWLFLVVLNAMYLQLSDDFNSSAAFSLFLLFIFGVLLTHLFRWVILKYDWLRMNKVTLVPLVILASVVIGAILQFTQIGASMLLEPERMNLGRLNKVALLFNIISMASIIFVWSLIYFLVHFIENYRKAEIENLKWEASINEIELNKLKSQLNPHFIFNSMNSIRALVDENPHKAKDSITQLSNILRNTLLMGKKKVISFDEEFKIVRDYLDLEATRFEERLKVKYEIQEGSEKFEVPPLMIQTLVENGIKHGISKLTAGGEIGLSTEIRPDNSLVIRIRNTGHLNGSVNENGFGIKSTRERLRLLYGPQGEFAISNAGGSEVLTTVVIPGGKVI